MNEESVKVHSIVDLVSYQKGAVVSRTLVDKKTGTITVFAFDSGEGLSEHTAPFDALVLVLDGEVDIRIGERSHRLVEGQMITMPANIPHELRAINRFKMLLVMIKN